jgi:inorganic triphosphatase YgiF
MSSPKEIELKFLVPAASRAALAAEMARGSATLERRTLAAMYLDTRDRRLARAGIAWRLRREGRRWIQALKAGGANALERFEHEVIRPVGTHDPLEHAGTKVGERLLVLLERARADGLEVEVRFRTEVRRTARRVRTRGAVVEIAFDEGRLLSGDARQRIREVEFELVSGSPVAMLALAERWRKRFGLIHDPRSKAERGDRLAQGEPHPPVRKAARPAYPQDADALGAFGAVLDECLSQVNRNAIGLLEGDPALRVDHVHQLRVGIRRLRSALRSFDGWVPMPPATLVDELRALFAELGRSRDSDVLDSGVVAELAKVGAPPLAMPAGAAGPDPVEAVRSSRTQALLLALIAWRAGLAEPPAPAPARPQPAEPARPQPDLAHAPTPTPPGGSQALPEAPQALHDEAAIPHRAEGGSNAGAPDAAAEGPPDAQEFRRSVERRLRRWHRRIAADWKAFDALEEESLHALRKRIKRQRYAVEFFAPVLRRRSVEQYLKPLAGVQERMGELNDLFVARSRYQELLAADPAAWFALGWLAARIAELRALAKPELGRLAKASPPVAR